jgi:hypothetical protein
MNGHLHVLQWAQANGCPWDSQKILQRLNDSDSHPEVVDWVESLNRKNK